MANNGTVKMLKIIGLAVGILSIFTGYVVSNDQNSRARDTKMKDEHRKDIDLLQTKIHANQITMLNGQSKANEMLARIEEKVRGL